MVERNNTWQQAQRKQTINRFDKYDRGGDESHLLSRCSSKVLCLHGVLGWKKCSRADPWHHQLGEQPPMLGTGMNPDQK